MIGNRMAGKSRLVMVLSYLESIEDPYQYGNNYGDLVEYLKMLIEGEEEYVPEVKKHTLSWMQKNEDGEWEEKSKLVNWEDIDKKDPVDIFRSGLLGEANHVKNMRLTESSTRDSWVFNSKHKYFAKENKPTKWSHNEIDLFQKLLKDSDYWKYPRFGEEIDVGHAAKDQKGKRTPPPKFIEWAKENAVRPEVTDDGKIIIDKEAFEETGSWGYSNKKNPFNFSPQTLKWIEDNAVEPERTKHGVIIEGSFDREDYLTEEDKAVWEINERRLDERIDELTENVREKVFLTEEYAHAKWKKTCEDKKCHQRIIDAINESPHDGSEVEKISLSGAINPVDLDEDFEEGMKDLMKKYDSVLRALVDK